MRLFGKVLSLVLVLIMYAVDAQMVTKYDTINGNVLSMTMDSRVSGGLEDIEENCSVSKFGGSNADGNSISKSSKILVPSRELTTAEICRQRPELMGYKIQVTVVKSMAEANEVRATFRSLFPNIKVMVDASLRPNYRILAGSYFSKSSAAKDLSRIRTNFKTATSVQYKIYCNEAK